jgi:hypothetical protein
MAGRAGARPPEERTTRGYAEHKDDHLRRLRRIEAKIAEAGAAITRLVRS